MNAANLGLSHRFLCFFVGCFAGALASFFPRLMAILAGDPTQQLQVFSVEYLMVGATVAVIVGIVILIIDSHPERAARDVFMTALGIPTLLMGALSTTATNGNIDSLQRQLEQTTTILRTQTGVDIRSGDAVNVPKVGPVSAWRPWDALVAAAYAQSGNGIGAPRQNSLGIAVRQNHYYLIYGHAADSRSLAPIQAKLKAAGISSQITPGAKGGSLLVPDEQPVLPYVQAVQGAVQAKQAGAAPYLAPAPGN